MSSSPIVNLYNTVFASPLSYVAEKIPDEVTALIKYFINDISADGFKTIVAKPVALIGTYLKYTGKEKTHPSLFNASLLAGATKTFISGFEILKKIPDSLSTLSTEVKRSERTRSYMNMNGELKFGADLSPNELVFKRLFSFADLAMGIADAIALLEACKVISPDSKLNRAVLGTYAAAGTYMGVQSIYEEWRHAGASWLNPKSNCVSSEKYYGYFKMALNATYLFSSVVGGWALYKNQPSRMLGNLQFAASVGIVLIPAIDRYVTKTMKTRVWS